MRERSPRPAAKVSPVNPVRSATPAAPLHPPLNHVMAKLRLGPVDDPLEREADKVADAIVGGGAPGAATAAPGGTVQRKCAACEDEERQVQRKADGTAGGSVAALPALRSGAPLPAALRTRFESQFGESFGGVRVHTDPAAQASARNIGARAYTTGHDIVFGSGEYQPHSRDGLHLLAHEMTHVVQQRGGAGAGTIQRRLLASDTKNGAAASPAGANAADILGVVKTLCPTAQGTSTTGGLNIQPGNAALCAPNAPPPPGGSATACRCLCQITASTNTWTIELDDKGGPRTSESQRKVFLPSPNHPVEFGAFGGGAQAGQRISIGRERILAHELCGHANAMDQGVHPADVCQRRGRPDHTFTINIENQIMRELQGPGFQERGTFNDPHQGESFGKITVTDFPTNMGRLNAAQRDQVSRAVRFLTGPRQQHGTCVFDPHADVLGHADHQGSDAANVQVSTNRAQNVRAEMIRQGVRPDQFEAVQGKGETECPACGGTDPNCANADCRKVEIFFFFFPAASERNP